MVRGGEGDRGGRGGRMGPPNPRPPRAGERGQSPPIPPEGENPVPPSDRDKIDQKMTGRSLKDHHSAPMGGGGGGGRYNRYPQDDRKIPRLKNTRHGARVGVAPGGEGERGTEKSQLPPVR